MQGCGWEKEQVPALFLPWPVTSLQAQTGMLPPSQQTWLQPPSSLPIPEESTYPIWG